MDRQVAQRGCVQMLGKFVVSNAWRTIHGWSRNLRSSGLGPFSGWFY